MGDERKEKWDNKTAVFQSRLDLKLLAELTYMLEDRYITNFRSISGLIKEALYILVQIGEYNEWGGGRKFDTYNEAYLYMMGKGLWAFNKDNMARESLNKAIFEKELIPTMESEGDRIATKMEEEEKRKRMDDMMGDKEKLMEALRKDGVLAEGDNENN